MNQIERYEIMVEALLDLCDMAGYTMDEIDASFIRHGLTDADMREMGWEDEDIERIYKLTESGKV